MCNNMFEVKPVDAPVTPKSPEVTKPKIKDTFNPILFSLGLLIVFSAGAFFYKKMKVSILCI